MKLITPPTSSHSGLGVARRHAVSVTSETAVSTRPLSADASIPLLVEPTATGVDLAQWAAVHSERVAQWLLEHRALLFRGFQIKDSEALDRVVKTTSAGDLLEYRDRSSPRHSVAGRIYTSTDYPASETIHLHNEGTYWLAWPLKIYFCCVTAAETGGETPIADCRRVYNRINPEIRQRFRERGVLYIRNYNDGFGLTWQTAYQTDDPAVVEAYCGTNDTSVEWKPGGRLRTRQVRRAIVEHPKTGEPIWFNHGLFFNVVSLPESVRDAIRAEFAAEDLPQNTFYGDGTPIEPETLDEIRRAYAAETTMFAWQPGDVMLLDNTTIAHARQPFTGTRRVLTAMSETFHPQSNAGVPQ